MTKLCASPANDEAGSVIYGLPARDHAATRSAGADA
jgi:hypothetical protein